MPQRIVIDPVSRIEGHAKISIFLDDAGEVSDARFHVTEFRGFERFSAWAGRSGRWPVSALAFAVSVRSVTLSPRRRPATKSSPCAFRPPREKLRRLMNLGQIVQSHALQLFDLSGPDLLLGWDSDPAKCNLFGLIAAEPEFARALYSLCASSARK